MILLCLLIFLLGCVFTQERFFGGSGQKEKNNKGDNSSVIEINDEQAYSAEEGGLAAMSADKTEEEAEADTQVKADEAVAEDLTEDSGYGDPVYCTIWPIQDLSVYSDPGLKEKIGDVRGGQTLCVLSEKDGSFEVCYDGDFNTGFVDERFCMINLPEYLKALCSYNITNSYDSVFRIHEYDIPDITGTVIPGFEDIALDPSSGSFVVPYLYPCAKRLMRAAENTRENGYVLDIYESFRPHKATRHLYDSVEKLLNEPLPDAEEEERTMSQEEVDAINKERTDASLAEAQAFLLSQGIDPASPQALPIVQFYLDKTELAEPKTYTYKRTYQDEMTNGSYKLSAFLAKQISAHNRGIALDLTLKPAETLKDLSMQSEIHDLSYHSVSSANNDNAKLLEKFMKAEGFNGLTSEWWHFQDDITRDEIKLSTYLEEGVSLEGFKADEKGFKYQLADGSFVAGEERTVDGKKYSFDGDGYCKFF